MTNMNSNNPTGVQHLLLNALLFTDGYKLGHHLMYPKGMSKLYSNFTPRANKYFPEADRGVVVFGIQYFIKKYLIGAFNEQFFNLSEEEVCSSYKSLLESFLGSATASKVGLDHVVALHRLGYLVGIHYNLTVNVSGSSTGSLCQ